MGEAAKTVPQIPARTDDEDEAEFKTSSVSHSFRLEWKIPRKTFTHSLDHTPRPMPEGLKTPDIEKDKIIENSKLFEFKNLKIHPFGLVLIKGHGYEPSIYLKLVTKEPTDGVKLEYAFASVDGQIFCLHLFDKSPLSYMGGQMFTLNTIIFNKTYKDIKIICGIRAISNVSHYSPGDSERFIMECSLPGDLLPYLGRMFWPTKSSTTAQEALTEYSLSGQLPVLDVDLAKALLDLSSKEKNAELKALCVKYLMRNLSAENVVGVLHKACDNHARALVARCKDFISSDCLVVGGQEEFLMSIGKKLLAKLIK